jgi:hypothetical protein
VLVQVLWRWCGGGGVTLPTALMFSFKTQSQISDTIQSSSQARNNEPIKAYVVTNDIQPHKNLLVTQ